MKVKDALSGLKDKKISNLKISQIDDDSRLVKQDSLFFVIRKPNFDIFSVLSKIEKKVKVYVADKKDKEKVSRQINNTPVIYVSGIEKVFYRAVKKYYKIDPKTKVIGVTGTNGKTSTAYFIYQLLKNCNKKAAFFGTIGCRGPYKQKTVNTTAGFLQLHKLIYGAHRMKVEYIVVEVSSHGISQGRIKGIGFSACLFTNLSRDHLDYHKNMAAYFKVKKSFFQQNKKAFFVINKDCRFGRKLWLELSGEKVAFSIKNHSDYQAKKLALSKNQSEFCLTHKNKHFSISLNLTGKHNILNVLAALAALSCLGFDLNLISKKVQLLKSPPGRLQEASPDIFVDYAHTPGALEGVLLSLRQSGYQKIILVFGCGGQRDKGKRELMGKVSSRLSDFSLITSDNPRKENPDLICRQIVKGIKANAFKVVINREEAIRQGISLQQKLKNKSKQKTCLLVAGKGHENYQVLNKKKIKFNDAKVVKEIIKNENF